MDQARKQLMDLWYFGITDASDGSEDDQIHCFKPDGSIPIGAELLRKAREDNEFCELT